MSRGIDFSKIQQDPEEPQGPTRHLVMAAAVGNLKQLTEQARRQYPFFGVLLPDPKSTRVSEYVRTYWNRLHKLSGTACLIATTLPPAQPTEEMRALLVNLVGEEQASKAWKLYRSDPEKMMDDTYELAADINVGYNRLPCLALMTDLDSNQKLIQRVPNWEADDLTGFFEAVFTKVIQHRQEPNAQRRLDALKSDLGMGFMLKLQAARAARGIHETLANVEWSEVIKSTLTNEEFLSAALKVVLGAFGVSAG